MKFKGFQIIRLTCFLFGGFTTGWYFFGFIGILIGLCFFLFLRDFHWKQHGLVLAWTSGISIIILTLIAFSNAAGYPSISTTYLAMSIGPGTLILYSIGYLVEQTRLKKRNTISNIETGLFSRLKKTRKEVKTILIIILAIIPIGFWWSVSVNWDVLTNNDPILLWVHAPTTVESGRDFDILIEAWDDYERVSASFIGTVSFTLQSYNLTTLSILPMIEAELPNSYTFSGTRIVSDQAYTIKNGRDNGLHVFTANIQTPGIHYILVFDSETQKTYWSNPIYVNNLASTNIYWGDIHGHSQLSDGSGTPDHHYYYARYIAGLEFNALTDHGETMQFTPNALNTLEKATNDAYEAGKFVAFQGVEWTQAKTGHITCIFSGNQIPKKPSISFFALPTPSDLWNALDIFTESTSCRALGLPHHTTKQEYPQDWTYFNPKYIKFAEVTSVHGECLFEQRDPYNYVGNGDPPPVYTPGTAIMDAFKMGYRFTLAGSADEHDGHPGHSLGHTNAFIGHQRPMTTWVNRIDLPYPGGITAVFADNCTREGIFHGLETQQIYAVSDHGRPYLSININGTQIGENGILRVNSTVCLKKIYIFLAQDGASAAKKRPLAARPPENGIIDWNATIEIFKNGNLLTQIPVNAPIVNETYIDTSEVTGTSYGIENCIEKDGKYYINTYSDNPIDPASLTTNGSDFYVFRVVGNNGRTIYAGPIWVEIAD